MKIILEAVTEEDNIPCLEDKVVSTVKTSTPLGMTVSIRFESGKFVNTYINLKSEKNEVII